MPSLHFSEQQGSSFEIKRSEGILPDSPIGISQQMAAISGFSTWLKTERDRLRKAVIF